jgi:uncharacterized membrane protein
MPPESTSDVPRRTALQRVPKRHVAAVAAFGVASAATTAIVPGLLAGAAVVLAPRYLPGASRKAATLLTGTGRRRVRARRAAAETMAGTQGAATRPALAPRLKVTQAAAKTTTFQIVTTGVSFSLSYLFIGNLVTAAALSGIWLIGGPVMYFVHESTWNWFSAADQDGPRRTVSVPAPWWGPDGKITLSRVVAKTMTWRSVAACSDFGLTLLVVGNMTIAVALTATGVVVGTCVFYGHERVWDRIINCRRKTELVIDDEGLPLLDVRLLPAP